MKTLLASLLVAAAMTTVNAGDKSIYDIPLKDIDKKPTSLKAHKGKALLIVNVASECGLTPQYEQLEGLHRKFKDKGFAVLGFPCNQFGGQEPGSNAEIKAFCSSNYSVTFPMFDKIDVKGKNQHALYKELSGAKAKFSGDVGWNFAKFLVGKDGKVVARFDPGQEPASSEVVAAIEKAIAAK
jgi:glutathione peroxidase